MCSHPGNFYKSCKTPSAPNVSCLLTQTWLDSPQRDQCEGVNQSGKGKHHLDQMASNRGNLKAREIHCKDGWEPYLKVSVSTGSYQILSLKV